MIFICKIISILLSVTVATGLFECNVTQNIKDNQCYGALGEPLIFHLPLNTKMTLRKNQDILVRFEKISVRGLNGNEYVNFVKKKTTTNDSGAYQLNLFDSDGKVTNEINCTLQILAPVSQPTMFETCLSQELRTVKCSAEGEDIDFTVSLDNNPLLQIKTCNAKMETVTVSLNGQLEGILQCNVMNNVSSKRTVIQITSCKGIHVLTVTAVASITVPLFLLNVYLGIKLFKQKKGRSPLTITEDDAIDNIVYSVVRYAMRKKNAEGHANNEEK